MGLAISEHEFLGVLSFSALLLEPCTCPAGVLGGGDGVGQKLLEKTFQTSQLPINLSAEMPRCDQS